MLLWMYDENLIRHITLSLLKGNYEILFYVMAKMNIQCLL